MFNKKPIKASVFAMGADKNGNRYGGSGFKTNFNLEKFGLKKWKIHEGRNLIDIIPYNAGKNHPLVATGQCEEGDTMYSLDYFVHKSIGPTQSDVTCLTQYGKRCPICEESKRHYALGSEEEKKKGTAFRAKRRAVYLIHDLIDNSYAYWDTGWTSFEEPVNKRASITIDPKTGAPINPFDWENGKSISFLGEKDKYQGRDFVKISDGTLNFEDRPPLSEEVLNHSVDLSEGIEIMSDEDMDNLLSGKPVVESNNTQQAPETTQAPVQSNTNGSAPQSQPSFDTMETVPQQTPQQASQQPAPQQAAPAQNAAPAASPENTCPFGHNWGEADNHKECVTCGAWDRCING